VLVIEVRELRQQLVIKFILFGDDLDFSFLRVPMVECIAKKSGWEDESESEKSFKLGESGFGLV